MVTGIWIYIKKITCQIALLYTLSVIADFTLLRVFISAVSLLYNRSKEVLHIWTCWRRLWGPSSVSYKVFIAKCLSFLQTTRVIVVIKTLLTARLWNFTLAEKGRGSPNLQASHPLRSQKGHQSCPCYSPDKGLYRGCRCAGCLWRCPRLAVLHWLFQIGHQSAHQS